MLKPNNFVGFKTLKVPRGHNEVRPTFSNSLNFGKMFWQSKRTISTSRIVLFAKKGPADDAIKKMFEIRKAAKEKERLMTMDDEDFLMEEESKDDSKRELTEEEKDFKKEVNRFTAYFMNLALMREKRKKLSELPSNISVSDVVKEKIYQLHKLNPAVFTVADLALRFGYQQSRILAWLRLKEHEKKEEKEGNLMPPDLLHLVEAATDARKKLDDRLLLEPQTKGETQIDFVDDELDELVVQQKNSSDRKR
eukprot:TRINITY_DN5397_c0_g1_i1.p1 TRINITY_DN5397_c0_g1~~TRINITY_DN5397_c0_g1_i1.p1  ORF type:complete len:269 (-),score=87.14 TRINITY_DN5397_c0_g1_i1:731-1483(-)